LIQDLSQPILIGFYSLYFKKMNHNFGTILTCQKVSFIYFDILTLIC